MRDWKNGKRKSMPFAIPMVWRGGKDHIMDCYFCMINLKEINRKNKHHLQYFDVPSATRPILHGTDLLVTELDDNMEYSSDSKHDCCCWGWHTKKKKKKTEEDNQPVSLAQTVLNDLTRDLKFHWNLFSCWVHISKRNIYWHQEQRSTERERERVKRIFHVPG